MKTITELSRHASPFKLPQALASDGESLWIGSLDTKTIYQIDPATWAILSQYPAPGLPFGIVSLGQELMVLCGETSDDNRYIRRLIPGHGFDTVFKIPCPDDTGSQLSYDGSHLHVSQWYNQKIHALGEDGQILKTYTSPRGICGQTIHDGHIYLINTAAEETTDYYLGRIDPATGTYEDLAQIPFPARSLAHDGQTFLTNHRSAHQTVRFTQPNPNPKS